MNEKEMKKKPSTESDPTEGTLMEGRIIWRMKSDGVRTLYDPEGNELAFASATWLHEQFARLTELEAQVAKLQPIANTVQRLEEWLWKDIENNIVCLEGNGRDYVCFLQVSSDSGLEPATTHGNTLAAAIDAALAQVEGENDD